MDVIIIISLTIIFLSFVVFCTILFNSSKIGKNRVRFYVARGKHGPLWLYIGKPVRGGEHFDSNKHSCMVSHSSSFDCLGLDIDDYKDLKWEDEPVEVFLNMEN